MLFASNRKESAIASLFDFPSTIHVHVHQSADPHLLHQLMQIAATLSTVVTTQGNIMTAISDFKAQNDVHNDKIDAAVTGLTGDVAELNKQIAALQATQGQITPEDQALLDGIQARSQAIADKLDALDALTPPAVPANP